MFRLTLENLEKVQDFDVLGHIDYVVRYGRKRAEEYSYDEFADEIDAVLKKVAADGKGNRAEYGRVQIRPGILQPPSGYHQKVSGAGRRDHNRGSGCALPEHVRL